MQNARCFARPSPASSLARRSPIRPFLDFCITFESRGRSGHARTGSNPGGPYDCAVKLRIQRAGIERLDELAPLWLQMQSHHESVAPATLTAEITRFRDHDGSWQRRRALYESWFAAGSAVLHVAEDGEGRLGGYAMVRLGSGGWAQLDTPEAMAEIESLSVGREHRGRGLGSRLIAAVHADLRERGSSCSRSRSSPATSRPPGSTRDSACSRC